MRVTKCNDFSSLLRNFHEGCSLFLLSNIGAQA